MKNEGAGGIPIRLKIKKKMIKKNEFLEKNKLFSEIVFIFVWFKKLYQIIKTDI